MKRCPECRRDYFDDGLNFCLDDGAWLVEDPGISDYPTEVITPDYTPGESGTKIFAYSSGTAASPAFHEAVTKQFNSIAVLPFAHLSSDADDEYFCDGLAEELINALAQIENLRVVARTSAFSFKGKNIDVSQIGNTLNVNTILEGSVRKSGDRLRITVQLINAADGYHIWSQRYDREMRDVFDLQDEITLAVVDALKSKLLGDDEDASLSALVRDLKHYRNDVDAYQCYLRGRFFLNKFTADAFYQALDCFYEAIEIDPGYALAYAGLADTHMMLTEMGPESPREAMPRAKEAALKALSLDQNLSEAHGSLGLVLQDYEFDFAGAEREFKRAIELNPNNSTAHQFYGLLLSQLSRHHEALAEFLKSLDVDPLSVVGNWVYAFGLFQARRYDDSIAQTQKTLELDEHFPAAFLSLGFSYHMKEDYAESVEAYAKFSELCGSAETAAVMRESFRDGGWHGFLKKMTSPDGPVTISSYIIGVFRAALHDNAGAIDKLEDSFANREPHIVMIKIDPRLDALRQDPRFQELLHKVGFPE